MPVLISFAGLLCLTGCGSASGASAPVSLGEVTAAASSTNPGFGTLSFDFAKDDGSSYRCFIAGLQGIETLPPETASGLAADIAEHFAAGSSTQIIGGENFTPIDAEKYSLKDSTSSELPGAYGDSNLCWAASAADMLVYSGWAEDTTAGSEDELMSEFTDAFCDEGSFQSYANKYYFNGINTGQRAEEAADGIDCRNAVFTYDPDDEDFFSAVQVREPKSNDSAYVNPGHCGSYAFESHNIELTASQLPPEEFASLIMLSLDSGCAVGIDTVFIDAPRNSRVGVHAMTVFGYIADEQDQLCGLFIADPDNNIASKKPYPASAEESLADRAACPNTLSLFPVTTFTFGDKDFLSLVNYRYSGFKSRYTDCTIQALSILKPFTSALNKDVETTGTADAVNTPDMTLINASGYNIETDLSSKAGDEVTITFGLKNASYRGYAASDRASAKCIFHIISEDGSITDSEAFDVDFVTDQYVTGEANCEFSVTGAYTFEKPGTYSVDVEILGVYDADGDLLPEAYTVNNYLAGAVSVTITDAVSSDPS